MVKVRDQSSNEQTVKQTAMNGTCHCLSRGDALIEVRPALEKPPEGGFSEDDEERSFFFFFFLFFFLREREREREREKDHFMMLPT